MPSYRITMTIGALVAGSSPSEVLPTAGAAAADVATLEASDLAIVAGSPRITIRFTADDEDIAAQVATHVVDSTSRVARVQAPLLTRLSAGRWNRVD